MRYQGGEVELRFFLECTLRGFAVSVPLQDTEAYDLILDISGRLRRVQIKSTSSPVKSASHVRYKIHADHGNDKNNRQYSPRDVDILAAYLIPIDLWYIIPVTEIQGPSLALYPHDHLRGHYGRFANNWDIL